MKKDVKHPYRILHPKIPSIIVSISEDGIPNPMACSWAMPAGARHVAISVKKTRYTHQLLSATKEFTLNIPTKKLLKGVWIAGTLSGKERDKAKHAKLTYTPSRFVKAPVIKQCIGHLECRIVQRVDLGEYDLFIGEILAGYAEERFFKDVWEDAQILLHLGKDRFSVSSGVFVAGD
jgi:flavin reductase (DIM6/NTAB) family NADH-FMN oxidoreductase RutF